MLSFESLQFINEKAKKLTVLPQNVDLIRYLHELTYSQTLYFVLSLKLLVLKNLIDHIFVS